MNLKTIFLFIIASLSLKMSRGQGCPGFGRHPSIAFPICGNSTIIQGNADDCRNHELNVPSCSGAARDGVDRTYYDNNPFWYKFTCYRGGTLGLLITPDSLNDDYNWQVYDITGHSPTSVFKVGFQAVPGLGLAGNWSGVLGPTGATPDGTNFIECRSDPTHGIFPKPVSKMPTLIVGHNYILLVSHATGTGGYTLVIGGGTADISDPTLPHLVSANVSCGGSKAFIKFNTKLKCSSAAPDASEFTIDPPLANVVGRLGIDCDHSTEMDSIALVLDHPLPPGDYSFVIKTGFDGNTFLDFCGRETPVGERIPFSVLPMVAPVMDSLTTPGCAPSELELVFKKPIACNSIATNGSDFLVTGPGLVKVDSAIFYCERDPFFRSFTTRVKVILSAPITKKGNYQLTLVAGRDGNTLLDECGLVIPAGSRLNFSIKDTVNADFTYAVHFGCKADTIDYAHNGNNETNSWKWNFDDERSSSLQNPQILYEPFGNRHVQLIVSNGGCSDTSALVTIPLGNKLMASFEADNLVCPGEPAAFKNTSSGDIVSWAWNFGNGNTSILRQPPSQLYTPPATNTQVLVQLSATDKKGCVSVASQQITLADHCYVLVPNAFTPNNDGLNDYLYPLNIFNPTGYMFRVFNRYGQAVFSSTELSKRWDGYYKGQLAEPGTYLWILHFTDTYTGKSVEQKGTVLLLH